MDGATSDGAYAKLGIGQAEKIIAANSTARLREHEMFLHVTGVRYLVGHKLEIAFNDGSLKEADLFDELHGEVFAPLKDLELFRQVFVNLETGTIEWPNGADFAPEFLHEIGREVHQTSNMA